MACTFAVKNAGKSSGKGQFSVCIADRKSPSINRLFGWMRTDGITFARYGANKTTIRSARKEKSLLFQFTFPANLIRSPKPEERGGGGEYPLLAAFYSLN